MQFAEPPIGNSTTRTAQELNAELAALRNELDQVCRERDEYRGLVQAFVARQGPAEVDDDEVLSHLDERPTVRELVDELTHQE